MWWSWWIRGRSVMMGLAVACAGRCGHLGARCGHPSARCGHLSGMVRSPAAAGPAPASQRSPAPLAAGRNAPQPPRPHPAPLFRLPLSPLSPTAGPRHRTVHCWTTPSPLPPHPHPPTLRTPPPRWPCWTMRSCGCAAQRSLTAATPPRSQPWGRPRWPGLSGCWPPLLPLLAPPARGLAALRRRPQRGGGRRRRQRRGRCQQQRRR